MAGLRFWAHSLRPVGIGCPVFMADSFLAATLRALHESLNQELCGEGDLQND